MFKRTKQSSCLTFKRPYDLERHLVKIHNMNSDEAKAHSTSGTVKTKTVKNLYFVDPGRLQPPRRKASVPGTGKPLSETVPGVTVPAYPDLKRLKVNFLNEMDCSEAEVVLPDKLSEGSGEPVVPDGTTQSTSVSVVTDAPPLPVPAVTDMPSTSVSLGTDTPPLPESVITDMPSLPCTSVPTVTGIPSLNPRLMIWHAHLYLLPQISHPCPFLKIPQIRLPCVFPHQMNIAFRTPLQFQCLYLNPDWLRKAY